MAYVKIGLMVNKENGNKYNFVREVHPVDQAPQAQDDIIF